VTDPAPPSTRRDQLVTLTDAKGNVTTWAYDALGRLTNHVTGAGHTQTLAYDSRISFGNRSLA